MKFLNRMELKYGRYAIHDLMKYILGLYILGTFLNVISPGIYAEYLCLDFSMVAKGQIWRMITFIMAPSSQMAGLNASTVITGLLFFFVEIFLYRMIGQALEQAWGDFRFNLYIFSGLIFNILAKFICHLVVLQKYGATDATVVAQNGVGLEYIFQTMFLAFAFLYPNVQLLLMFVIPVKVKWLGYFYGAILAFQVISNLSSPYAYGKVTGVAILISTANFILFALLSMKSMRPSREVKQRRKEFRRQARVYTMMEGEARHRCAVCGRTELDNPELEFRFCSKCEGNFEYCSDHLFTHEHVKRK